MTRFAARVAVGIALTFALVAGVTVMVAMSGPEGGRTEAAVAADLEPRLDRSPSTVPPAPAPAQAEEASPASDASNAPLVVTVRMEEFLFAPHAFTVPAGRLIRFEVTNPGALPHELLIGDRHAQDDAEKQMAKGGSSETSHSHGADVPSLYLEAGGRGVLEVTFDEPGELLIGCHVPGHWAAGMRGTLTVSR